ncbi:MAG: nodulation protein NfeD [Candidatus Bathyarchaeia archaeon]
MINQFRYGSKILTLILLLTFSSSLMPFNNIHAATNPSGPIIVVNFDVQVDPGSSLFVKRAVNQAITSKASAIIITMDTPGGLLNDMTSIVSSIADANASGIPTYTYVPPNSLAASAGSYIAFACNKIIMGSGSEIGPSTPILVGATTLEQNHTQAAMLSLLVGLAQKWGRNTTAAYQMVQNDVAYSTDQALRYHIINSEADSLNEAINDLGLTGQSQININENIYEQFISALSNPTLDGLLILVGVIAIVLDIQHASIVLTIVGTVSILAGLIGAEVIDASILGFLIIAIAAVLIFLELKTGHGLSLMAGVILGAFGIFYLANGLSYSPSPITFSTDLELFALIVIGIFLGLYFRWVIGPLRQKPKITGPESLINETGVAVSDLTPKGEVRVSGIIWRAESTSGNLTKDDKIKVKRQEGLVLIVEKEKD